MTNVPILSFTNIVHHLPILRYILCRPFCSSSQSACVPTFISILVSSANFSTENVISSLMSFMKITNSVGPSPDPCGTPFVTDSHPDSCPFISTGWLLSLNQASIHLQIHVFLPTWSGIVQFLWSVVLYKHLFQIQQYGTFDNKGNCDQRRFDRRLLHCFIEIFSTMYGTLLLNAALIPSTGPLSWLVALKSKRLFYHVFLAVAGWPTWHTCSWTDLLVHVHSLTSVASSSISVSSSMKTTAEVFSWHRLLLITAWRDVFPQNQATDENSVTWAWFQWADCISSWAIQE